MLRQGMAVFFIIVGVAALGISIWINQYSKISETTINFQEADTIHKSVYGDADISKLLEQNLRMQEAIFSAQKQSTAAMLKEMNSIQFSSNRQLVSVLILITISILSFILALLIFPRAMKLEKNSIAQLETILWQSWVVDKKQMDKDEFTVQKAAYPVHLCGCSSSGVPVHLCGCQEEAYPVPLCGCSSGYLEECKRIPPNTLCKC